MIISVIGTRKSNEESNLIIFNKIKEILKSRNLYPEDIEEVRSGNAYGVDQVANKFLDLGIKVKHYVVDDNHNPSLRRREAEYVIGKGDYDELMYSLFPWIKKQSYYVKMLISRNMSIICGKKEEKPSNLVFWFTGKGLTGGTSYGVKLARHLGIEDIEVTI
jgi:hypothetical protein